MIEWSADAEPEHIEHGVFAFSSDLALSFRLADLYGRLKDFFVRSEPAVMAIEKVFLGKNPDSVFKLGHMRAIALLVAQQHHCQIAEYAPRTVKKVVTGHGGAEKDHVRKLVMNALSMESTARSDATDALALALCHGYKTAMGAFTKQLQEIDL
jgi:crossover junction endodeoxyribonuclease RuvC